MHNINLVKVERHLLLFRPPNNQVKVLLDDFAISQKRSKKAEKNCWKKGKMRKEEGRKGEANGRG